VAVSCAHGFLLLFLVFFFFFFFESDGAFSIFPLSPHVVVFSSLSRPN